MALMNSLATLRTDVVSPVKFCPYPISHRDAGGWSPLSLNSSTNSTPFMTPRSSLSPVHPTGMNGVAIFEQFAVSSGVGPSSGEIVSKSPHPPSFRAVFGAVFNEKGLHVAEAAQGGMNNHLLMQTKPIIISSSMLAAEIIPHLINSGCPDVTDKLDLSQCATHPIAGGGFGDIYQGVLVGGMKVAIKCPRLFLRNDEQGNKILKNIAREIYAWSKLKHPNVLELVGLSTFRGQISIVSSWMENGTLPDYVTKHPEADRFELCAQVASGLAYLHKSDTIHGDVKGLAIQTQRMAQSNVLVSESGVAKLADFGNTVIKKHTLDFTDSTGAQKISVRWTAPELLRDEEKHTKEADVYALGMTFLETVMGKVPFPGKSEQVVLATIMLGRTPERPAELDLMDKRKAELLWKMMSRCWSHTVSYRPSASEVERSVSR
ncbi:hypothetical protein FRC07_009788 [Ceratobasidium sp. 392]|nr:hypothetical protein FRC07_009788 [Ceratobasidium sp. 392]